MIQVWIAKKIVGSIINAIQRKHDLKRIDDYVNKPNELDKQMKQVQKTVSKYGRVLESIEKDIAQLKVDSHPPVFMKNDYKDIIKRLKKLEKKEK